jgi:pilus assembly protein CpaB
MRSKLLIIAAALVLAAIAAFASFQYLDAVRREAEAGSRMTEVLVAKSDIARGMSADDMLAAGLIERVQIPQRYVAQGAISSVRSVADRILAVPVSKGEILTATRFQYPSEAGLAFNVPKDYVAVTVPVDEARAVAGLVKPGDRVAIVATVEGKGSQGGEQTRIMIPGARVLAVGRSTGVESNSSTNAQASGGVLATGSSKQNQAVGSVTVALSPVDAEKVIFAVEAGRIWLALLPTTASEAAPGPGQSAQTVLK